MISTTAERVWANTSEEVNDRIRHYTDARVSHAAMAGPEAVARRLHELDEEWDVERCLEAMASTITLTGLVLAVTASRKWLLLPAVVQTFFLQHAVQGWCPPLPVLRRLGVRTAGEINEERYALKALRGDFRHTPDADEPGAVYSTMQAVRR
jgi:hypothetical protein